ncbi:MAG: GH92 family glycosyl hydrolase [Bacteroidota bacterium]|nr:GH92 family glycosyl hydrolase [Bacteroidota bacterium]
MKTPIKSQFSGLLRAVFVLPLFFAGSMGTHSQSLCSRVDPRIGSTGPGRVFVGPCAPFGMAKPGPDCISMPNAGWAPMPEAVKGFSQTHVSGTGGGQKYGNVLIQPFCRSDRPTKNLLLLPDSTITTVPVYAAQRTMENIGLGYYECTYGNGIRSEITPSDRCTLYRFHGADALLIDAASFLGMDTIPNKREAQQYVGSHIAVNGKREINGWTTVRGGWNNGGPYTVFFCLQTNVPFNQLSKNDGKTISAYFDSKTIEIKVGISYLSVDQARQNIVAHGFSKQLKQLHNQWETMLSRVKYKGTEKERRMFYTALYHPLLMPVDKTGENPGRWSSPYYDDFYAIWDTYRTSFPLLMEYYPDRAVAMINALLGIYKHEGYLPDARSGDCNGRTQGGSNAEVVIAEAFARGLKGIDYDFALGAMVKDADVAPADDEKEGRGGLEEYNRLGYVPYGIPRAGTRTVEYSYDDWCIAQVAKGLGHDDLYQKYMHRSTNWKNLWRNDYEWQGMRGFILPRDAQGQWLDSVPWGKSSGGQHVIAYKPDTKVAPWYIPWWNTFFYEALSAEYSLSIPHDILGLIQLCGGDSAFCQRLDTFFENGHYNVGNEPSFLTPYLYHYIGRPDLSADRVAKIVNNNFSDAPNGLPGNDDSGAMSAWLLWAMQGRYPVAGQNKWLEIPPVRIDSIAKERTKAEKMTTKLPISIPTGTPSYDVHFTLNRQYRTGPLHYWDTEEGLNFILNGAHYVESPSVIEHATTFCWDNPQVQGALYHCQGTFLSISRDAYKYLLTHGEMNYDGLHWRELDRTNDIIHVRSDVDNSEMWIMRDPDLPLVKRMKGNKLGIDWWMSQT